MPRHHCVPQFLLRNWATNGQLVSYHRNEGARRVIESTNTSVSAACQIEDLNAFYGLPRPARNAPEDEFFTPQVDTPAAMALEDMLPHGVDALTPRQCEAFARFLVSFGVRTPETLREMGPNEFPKAMEIAQGRAGGPPDLEAIVTGLLERGMTALERNVPLQIAMELAGDPAKRDTVVAMHWLVREFDPNSILIGDRPLVASPAPAYPCGIPLDNPNCLIFLPLAPERVFFASPRLRTICKLKVIPRGDVARTVNEDTIKRATQYVYAADTSLSAFVKEKMAAKASAGN